MLGSFDECENQLNYCDDNKKVHYDQKRGVTVKTFLIRPRTFVLLQKKYYYDQHWRRG